MECVSTPRSTHLSMALESFRWVVEPLVGSTACVVGHHAPHGDFDTRISVKLSQMTVAKSYMDGATTAGGRPDYYFSLLCGCALSGLTSAKSSVLQLGYRDCEKGVLGTPYNTSRYSSRSMQRLLAKLPATPAFPRHSQRFAARARREQRHA